MKKKLKVYCTLLVVVLGVVLLKNLNVYHSSWSSQEGEELILDSLNENFAIIDKTTETWTDTINGSPVTHTSTHWHSKDKLFVEVTVPVRHREGANSMYLYSRLRNGQQVIVDMKQASIKVPVEAHPQNNPILFSVILISCLFVPLYIWLFVIIWKVLRSVYKGEVFVTQIAKGLEKAGKILFGIWLVGKIAGFVVEWILKESLLLAYYDVDVPILGNLTFAIFGLALMIVSQIILMGKDLKEEQDLTI